MLSVTQPPLVLKTVLIAPPEYRPQLSKHCNADYSAEFECNKILQLKLLSEYGTMTQTYLLNHFHKAFAELSKGNPYWTAEFLRPLNSDFYELLTRRSFDVTHICFWLEGEDVYFPTYISVDQIKKIASLRASLRANGVDEEQLPII